MTDGTEYRNVDSMRSDLDGVVHRAYTVGIVSLEGVTLVNCVADCGEHAVGDIADIDQLPITCIACLAKR